MKIEFDSIFDQISKIQLIGTYEHLIDETARLNCMKPFIQCDDWTTILGHYSKFDFVSSGMSKNDVDLISSAEINPIDKWKIIEPYWDLVKHAG